MFDKLSIHHLKYSLDINDIIKIADQGYNVIPIYQNCIFDMDTPVSLYIKSGGWKTPYSFLLESVTGGENIGRYSYLGLSNEGIITGKKGKYFFIQGGKKKQIKADSALESLKKILLGYKVFEPEELSGFYAGAVGFFSYEIIHDHENLGTIPKKDTISIPDLHYILPKLIIWFDHAKRMIKIISNIYLEKNSDISLKYEEAKNNIHECLQRIISDHSLKEYEKLSFPKFTDKPILWNCDTTDEEYKDMVTKAKNYIKKGDIFQVVLSKRFFREYQYDPFFLYRSLRVVNPSPYMFYLHFPDHFLVGSSPEILVKKKADKVLVRPIAGTIARGKNIEEDEKFAQKLLLDKKEIAEHIMLVDLGRNDLGKISEFGSVKVDEFMIVEKYSHVMHIVSNVTGRLKYDKDSFDCLWATFPAGTVSGAPKVRAMQIIEEMEKEVRGVYSGCVGFFSFNGDMDVAITLRTMLVRDKTVYLQAGAGIVFDSIPEAENNEVFKKLQALFQSVELFYSGGMNLK